MSFDGFTRRITKLWAAALVLEAAAKRALEHLPPTEKQELQKALRTFEQTRQQMKRKAL
jgi:hypothetical protein